MDKKKQAAALAAVTAYIKGEEEAYAAAMAPPPYRAERVNAWGMNGRQSQMQVRNLMQLRTFARLR